MLTNAGGRAGDALVLTKPLGVGAVVSARKRGLVDDALLVRAIDAMTALNDVASRDALDAGAHAATDVTGFGLLGHLHHLCRESGVAAEVDAEAVPALEGVEALLAGGEPVGRSGGSARNAAWAEGFAAFDYGVAEWRRRLLVDATTSGGLLVALPQDSAGGVPGATIGRLVDGPAGTIRVR
jgi:selenide,water dikinase